MVRLMEKTQKKRRKVLWGCGLAALVVTLLAAVLFRTALRQMPWQQSVPALLALWTLAWSSLYALCRLPHLVRRDFPRATAVALCGLLVLRWAKGYYVREVLAGKQSLFSLLCDSRIMVRGVFVMLAVLLMPRLYRFNEEQLRLPWLERALRLAEWAAFTLMGVESMGLSYILWAMSNWKILLNFVLLILLCMALYGLIGRLYPAVCLTSAVVGGGAVANYYVWRLRGTPLVPADLLAVGTAARVAGQYRFAFYPKVLVAVIYIAVGCVLAAPLRKTPAWVQKYTFRHGSRVGWKRTLLKRLICIALGVGAVVAINIPKAQTRMQLTVDYWKPANQYMQDGFTLAFMDSIGRLWLSKPDTDSDERLEALEETYPAQQTADGNVVNEPDSERLADYDTLQYALLKGLGSFAS